MLVPRCKLGGLMMPARLATLLALGAVPVTAQVKVSGVGYAHFRYQLDVDSTASPPARQNNFDVDRSYITVETPSTDHVSARVTVDVDNREAGEALLFRLKYAYATWRPGGGATAIQLGMIPTPLIQHTERIWDYRMQGRVAMDRNRYLISSDIGIGVDGSWHDDRLQFAGGVYNGEGYQSEPGDHRKDVAARVSVRLASSDTTGRTAGLQLSGYGHYGRATGGGIRSRWLAMLSWQSRRLTLGAEHGWTTDSTGVDLPRTHGTVTSVWGVYRAGDSPLAALARFDRVDRDVDVTPLVADHSTGVHSTLIVGVSYRISPQLRVLVDADLHGLEHGSPDNAFNATRRTLFVHTEFRF